MDLKYYGNLAFGIALALGICTIITGFLGLTISKYFNKKASITFAIMIFVLSAGLLSGGIVLMQLEKSVDQTLLKVCRDAKIWDFQDNVSLHNLVQYGNVYDSILSKQSSESMCTAECPCDPNYFDEQTWDEELLNKYSRTKLQTHTTDNNQTFTGFTFSQNGHKNFKTCYDKLDIGDPARFQLPEFVFNIVYQLETILSCNSFCEQSLFFLYKDLSAGPPQKMCQQSIRDLFKLVGQNCGITLVVAFAVAFMTCVFQIFIYKTSEYDYDKAMLLKSTDNDTIANDFEENGYDYNNHQAHGPPNEQNQHKSMRSKKGFGLSGIDEDEIDHQDFGFGIIQQRVETNMGVQAQTEEYEDEEIDSDMGSPNPRLKFSDGLNRMNSSHKLSNAFGFGIDDRSPDDANNYTPSSSQDPSPSNKYKNVDDYEDDINLKSSQNQIHNRAMSRYAPPSTKNLTA
eukprot:403339451